MPIDDGQTPFTEKYFGGETALAAHRRLDKMQSEIAELKKKVDAIPSETRALLAHAFLEHEERERSWRVDPEVVADKVEKRIWGMFLGEDLATSPDAAKYKRTLQEVWRGTIKVSPYVFNGKMVVFMLFVAAVLLGTATSVLEALKRKTGLP